MHSRLVQKTVVISILLIVLDASVVPLISGTTNHSDFDTLTITTQTTGDITTITYHIPDFSTEHIMINDEAYSHLFVDDEPSAVPRGMPALPTISRSIIIPGTAKMDIRVTHATYREYDDIFVAPSKGNLFRDVDPDDVPYEFDEIYSMNTWFPQTIAELGDPYVLRDFRGQVIRINPFQYNPVQKQLRFFTDIAVEIYPTGPSTVNCYTRTKPLMGLDTDFNWIYEHHFLNFNNVLSYTPVAEQGNMLVITYDDFYTTLLPFVQWKTMKGIRTTMVKVSEIGDANAIKNYITNYYNTMGLTFVLLVGDAAQVPPLLAGGHASDPSYSYVVGNDHYPDLFVGRFSAETIDQVATQIERTIEYEKYPQPDGDWYHTGAGIASAGGPGDDGEYDWEHMRNIRSDLLGYYYTQVDELYDGTHGGEDASGYPTSSMVASVVNDGRSIINYCGHGTTTSWSTTGFNNNDVNVLMNDNMLPFIFSVGCNNGNFVSTTCFAETWLRATHDTEPTGAIAAFMSSIRQQWEPPMDAQDEMVDLLVESYEGNKKITFAGLAFHGCIHMNDEYPEAGPKETDAWHVFGDPSLQVRTDTPQSMTVVHNSTISIGGKMFYVDVPEVEGAVCALSQRATLLGYGITDALGHAEIPLATPPSGIGTVDLVVTAYNKIPYMSPIFVGGGVPPEIPTQPSGPLAADVGESCEFSVDGVVDLDNQDVSYLFDWDDGTTTGWLGPYPPEVGPIKAAHQWKKPGYYNIKVKAKDSYGKESDFSEPLIIEIGHRFDIGAIIGGFGVSIDVVNTLPVSKYADWQVEIAGGSLPGFHVNKRFSGSLYTKSGSIETITIPPFFALGRVQIRVTVQCAGESSVTKNVDGRVLFFLVLVSQTQ